MTYKEKITITYENDGKVYTASYEGAPIKRSEALEWFENQALVAIGFALEGKKHD